eukprot:6019384-Amphidinium_carterae.1
MKVLDSMCLRRVQSIIPGTRWNQFGFTKGKSAGQHLTCLSAFVHAQFVSSQHKARGSTVYLKGKALAIGLDFDKAFDVISPDRILRRLSEL